MTQSDNTESVKLQVLICTLGEAGIRRVAEGSHPRVPGVEYLVSWQLPDGDTDIPKELIRSDFKIYKTKSKGIAINRNHAISKASAPLALMTDDDVSYTEKELKNVIKQYKLNPTADLITFKYHSSKFPKTYPKHIFNLNNPPKGYYVTCFEITFRTSKIKKNITFNPHFGFNTTFHGGEEEVFIYDAIKSGINCVFIPCFVGTHNHSTTGDRDSHKDISIITKGAIFYHTHSKTWFLHMLAHALREKNIPFHSYCLYWIKGVFKAIKLNSFN